jgi:hypothetical protein
MSRLVDLVPVSKGSVRLTVGEAISTTVSEFSVQDGKGPQCPRCGGTMRPLPQGEPTLVRCEEGQCVWFMAPFRSDVPAVRPVKPDE